MPVNGKVLEKFPKRYQGTYVNKADDSKLYINDWMILREHDYTVKIHIDSLGATDSLAGDTVFHIGSDDYDVVNVEDDTLSKRFNWTDTVFIITPEPVLRKYKGYLFLNTLYESGYEVQQLKLKKGVLELNYISTPEEIEMLNEFEENDSDTIASPYSPTKREFRKFIKTEGFQEGEQFVKIREK